MLHLRFYACGCGGCCACGGWDPFVIGGDCAGCAGRSGVFPVIFVLYSNDLPYEALLSISSVSSL